ncbi:hypothetical protein ACI1US_01340 [Leucobacter sp. BZR 635]
MQPVVHPGPVAPERIVAVPVWTRSTICELLGGLPLTDQLHRALSELGADSGFAEIHGGEYAPLSYCIPDVATAEHAMSFSETRQRDRVHLLYGSVTLGVRDGAAFMHSHSMWQTPTGAVEGGHLWPETKVGDPAPVAVVTAIYGAQWRNAPDIETGLPVFTPVEQRTTMEDQQGSHPDTVVARVLPNVDITEAVLRVCREAGFASASIRAGVGSLVGATLLDRVRGGHLTIDGPATEVIALFGDVRTKDGELTVRLTSTLVDRHGVIHSGELVPGENLVGATFDLTVQNIGASTIVAD